MIRDTHGQGRRQHNKPPRKEYVMATYEDVILVKTVYKLLL
jgi:hypothetical protein